MVLVIIYVAALLAAAYVRFWTEGGFWQAVHTGRTFMLQAATLSAGIGVSHLDLLRRLSVLKPYLPSNPPPEAADALIPPMGRLFDEPLYFFGIGGMFLLGYILTGFFESDFLTRVGAPPRAKKYVDNVSHEPTGSYKVFISLMLALGLLFLLIPWYWLLVRELGGLWSYMIWVVLPTYLALGVVLIIGPRVARWRKGTEGIPAAFDVGGIRDRRE